MSKRRNKAQKEKAIELRVSAARIKQVRAEARAEAYRLERDQANAVIADLMEDRGQSWLAKLVSKRELLLSYLRGSYTFMRHSANSDTLLGLLAVVGGEAEIERLFIEFCQHQRQTEDWDRRLFFARDGQPVIDWRGFQRLAEMTAPGEWLVDPARDATQLQDEPGVDDDSGA